MKRAAVFDIDGTIFRSSLLIELTEALIQEGIFPVRAKKVYAAAYKKWLNRQDSYEKYLEKVIKAFDQNIQNVVYADFIKVAEKTASFHKNRIYRYTRDLVKKLRRQNYFLIAISNSPREILETFCHQLGFHEIYGRLRELNKKNQFTNKTLFEDLANDKAKLLKRALLKDNLTLKKSVGVGDSETDIPFLKMVAKPICFNPNQKLYRYAKQKGWTIVVERKDVIYKISQFCHKLA